MAILAFSWLVIRQHVALTYTPILPQNLGSFLRPVTHLQNRYSLWLRPSQNQIDELAEIISKLAQRYCSAPFPPHITLLSSISTNTDAIKEICVQIIEEYSAFNIPLEEISYSEAYFRNLYILANSGNILADIYEETKYQLRHEINEAFMPHVSLHYGKLEKKKQQALKEKLVNSYPKLFSCQRIDLYNTSGKESEWHLINSFHLRKA